MSYEDQLIREATGQGKDFVETEPEAEATVPRTEMKQQGKNCNFSITETEKQTWKNP